MAKQVRRQVDLAVGTVSQTDGLPTGSIIESGSNANGNYVKFADGTMACWVTLIGTGFNLSASSYRTWTYPVEFSEQPTLFVSMQRSADDVQVLSARQGALNTTTQANVAHSGGSTTGCSFKLFAVGRWF